MKILQKISGLFTGPGKGDSGPSLRIAVRCGRCGELIEARVDLNNDLSAEFGEEGREAAYFCRKVLIGKQGCYIPVEVLLKFDARRRLTDKQVNGGTFVEGLGGGMTGG